MGGGGGWGGGAAWRGDYFYIANPHHSVGYKVYNLLNLHLKIAYGPTKKLAFLVHTPTIQANIVIALIVMYSMNQLSWL